MLLIPISFRFFDLEKISEVFSRISWLVYSLLLIPYILLVFYLFSVKTYFLGDGYLLINNLETGNYPVKPWDQISYSLQRAIYELLGNGGEQTAILTFQLISDLSGFIFLVATFWFAALYYKENLQKFLFILFISSGGYMLLFFGYAENYPIFVTLVFIYGLLGLLIAGGEINRFWLLIPLGLASLFHPFVVAMLPGAGYLLLRNTIIASKWNSLKRSFKIPIIIVTVNIVLITFIYYYTQSDFLKYSLLPFNINKVTVENYWLFSINHLLDYANLLLQLLPAIPLIFLLFLTTSWRELSKRNEICFLSLLVIPSLLIVCIIDPKLGMARDWDLFSFAAIPLMLLCVVLLDSYKSRQSSKQLILILSIFLNLFILIPRALTQNIPDKSIEYFENIANLDRVKYRKGLVLVISYLEKENRKYEAADKRARFQQTYPEERWFAKGRQLVNNGRYDEGVNLFRKVLASNPTFIAAWSNIGVVFSIRKQFDSALVYMKIAYGLDPFRANSKTNLGGVYFDLGVMQKAEGYWKDAAKINKDHLRSRLYLLSLYKSTERWDEYRSMHSEIANMETAPLEILVEELKKMLEDDNMNNARQLMERLNEKGVPEIYLDSLIRSNPELL